MRNSENTFEQGKECNLIRALPDGSLFIELFGKEQAVQVYGIDICQPPPQEYFEIIDQRLRRVKKGLRCVVKGGTHRDQVTVQLFYFGWQDKSGDVWLDLAPVLLREGFACIASVDFPEKQEYLQYKRKEK